MIASVCIVFVRFAAGATGVDDWEFDELGRENCIPDLTIGREDDIVRDDAVTLPSNEFERFRELGRWPGLNPNDIFLQVCLV